MGACTKPEPSNNLPQSWEQELTKQIKLLGHRNWIVVADAAYPLQSKNGITTILSETNHQETIDIVNALIAKENHIRPLIHLDKEIDFVQEEASPGIMEFKNYLRTTLPTEKVNKELHECIISKLDKAAEVFNVVIIKTNFTIPYTSVFFQLDCAYWSADKELELRSMMNQDY